MSKQKFALRTHAFGLFAVCCCISNFAAADPAIQMLPPTPLGTTSACTGGNQILPYSATPAPGPQGGINCVPVTTDADGNIAASGYVQAGNTTAPCSAALAGAIRFNTATHNFEGCTGSGAWTSFGGVPSGTVAAFTNDTCPAGWNDVPALSGRTIIGDGIGAGLSPRNLNDYGGEEKHTMTLAELVPHTHSVAFTTSDPGRSRISFDMPTSYQPASCGSNHSELTEPTGNGQPFNVMMPWYALHYCVKL